MNCPDVRVWWKHIYITLWAPVCMHLAHTHTHQCFIQREGCPGISHHNLKFPPQSLLTLPYTLYVFPPQWHQVPHLVISKTMTLNETLHYTHTHTHRTNLLYVLRRGQRARGKSYQFSSISSISVLRLHCTPCPPCYANYMYLRLKTCCTWLATPSFKLKSGQRKQ